jgi:hypothetical protein
MEACLMELVAFQSVSLSEDDFHKEGTAHRTHDTAEKDTMNDFWKRKY